MSSAKHASCFKIEISITTAIHTRKMAAHAVASVFSSYRHAKHGLPFVCHVSFIILKKLHIYFVSDKV